MLVGQRLDVAGLNGACVLAQGDAAVIDLLLEDPRGEVDVESRVHDVAGSLLAYAVHLEISVHCGDY